MHVVTAALAAALALTTPQAPPPDAPPGAAAPAPAAAPATAPATPPSNEKLIQWGREVGELLLKNDTDGIAERFSPKLVGALPPWRFGQGWHGIENRNGKLRTVGDPEVKGTGASQTVVVPLQMERSEWKASLAFDAEGQITSVRFAPASMAPAIPPAAEWRAPAYVNPKKFRDVDVRIGAAPWTLMGALSLPAGKGPFPAVVLVHGSGPNDQDETVGGIKPFRDIAWGLASQGIAVLRYEKRTRTYGQKMAKLPVTVKEETIEDVLHALEFLRDNDAVDARRIVILGHSLGGYLAPRIASESKVPVAGLVIMAGPTRPIPDLVDEQVDYLVAAGVTTEEAGAPMKADAQKIRAIDPAKPTTEKLLGAGAEYWLDLRGYDPAARARQLGVPVLVLQGGRDYQITQKDLDGWKKGLAGAPSARFQVFPEANHLMVNGQGKSLPSELQMAGNVGSGVIDLVAEWVKALPPRK
ncbi:MAG TPA: alpha/beta fold hydrolase [Anaeromyxobacteraceae bacterium]|nr:alpha/beta fold hydrolase [Anaeromyxobacteraceae bacterium]